MAVLVSGCAGITPSHEIPPRPDYVLAGVQVGDTVEVTTVDGKERSFIVVRVDGRSIQGEDEIIPLGDVKKLVKRSWEIPGHPCGGGEPVGCSIPEVVLLLSSDYEAQAQKFHPACVTHDFCYRHGYATYGTSRAECDATFLEDMNDACKGPGGLAVLDVRDHGICLVAATQTYEAVRKYGADHYRTADSTYCEYRWEPE